MAITGAELRSEVIRILNATDGSITEPTYVSPGLNSADAKWGDAHIDSFLNNAIAEVAALVAEAGDDESLFLLAKRTADLGDNSGQLILSASVVSGPIIQVEVSYDSSNFTYQYAEPDSATSIRRYRARKTAGALTLPLYSFAIEGKTLYYPGTRVAISFIPEPFTSDNTVSIPRKLANAIVAIALSYLFAYDGAGSYINAAQYFASLAANARQLILANKANLIPFPTPYQGA